MSNARNPFDMDDGIEDVPVVKATTNVVKQATGTVAKQTAQQAKLAAQAFVNQLYGVGGTTDTTTDTSVDPQQQVQKQQNSPQSTPVPQAPTSSQQPQQQVPSDQAKLEQTRRALQQTHTSEYFNPTIGDLETNIKKEEQKRMQAKQQEEQEEEQKKVQMEELKEQKKNETPVAVQIAKTKSERRPGAG